MAPASKERNPPRGQGWDPGRWPACLPASPALPEPLTGPRQVGESHQPLEILQGTAVQVQEAHQGPDHLVDLQEERQKAQGGGERKGEPDPIHCLAVMLPSLHTDPFARKSHFGGGGDGDLSQGLRSLRLPYFSAFQGQRDECLVVE